MPYDKVKLVEISLPLFDFGGGAAETYSFRLPTGMSAKLVKIGVGVTEVFATDTTLGSVEIGTAADADAYAKLEIPDTSADNDFIDETDDTDAIISKDIDADTLIKVTLTNGTDSGSVTGQGIPKLSFEMYEE